MLQDLINMFTLTRLKIQDKLLTFLGLLLHADVDKSWDVAARELFFLDKCANTFFRATMSVN
ncbi:hypothetical protein PR048_005415 [Dryococelus australis]|uniref:Uncharacterized protein n=1 Tax=Dryococelus australis TaxID=614101 RepID=A0ABQ9I852_9NEOP|nr:hypothetical protein PR048_005415 [Dryococelus australis]